MSAVDPADFDALIELVKSSGVFKSVSYDPAEIRRMPGCWVRVDQIDVTDTLSDGVADVPVTFHLVTSSQPAGKAFPELAGLLNALCSVLTPSGPAVPTGVVLPGSSAGLPALAVPFTMHSQEGDTP